MVVWTFWYQPHLLVKKLSSQEQFLLSLKSSQKYGKILLFARLQRIYKKSSCAVNFWTRKMELVPKCSVVHFPVISGHNLVKSRSWLGQKWSKFGNFGHFLDKIQFLTSLTNLWPIFDQLVTWYHLKATISVFWYQFHHCCQKIELTGAILVKLAFSLISHCKTEEFWAAYGRKNGQGRQYDFPYIHLKIFKANLRRRRLWDEYNFFFVAEDLP